MNLRRMAEARGNPNPSVCSLRVGCPSWKKLAFPAKSAGLSCRIECEPFAGLVLAGPPNGVSWVSTLRFAGGEVSHEGFCHRDLMHRPTQAEKTPETPHGLGGRALALGGAAAGRIRAGLVWQ